MALVEQPIIPPHHDLLPWCKASNSTPRSRGQVRSTAWPTPSSTAIPFHHGHATAAASTCLRILQPSFQCLLKTSNALQSQQRSQSLIPSLSCAYCTKNRGTKWSSCVSPLFRGWTQPPFLPWKMSIVYLSNMFKEDERLKAICRIKWGKGVGKPTISCQNATCGQGHITMAS